MNKGTLFTIAALAAFTFAPSFASAEESAPKVSYAAKKQGHVPFQSAEEEAAVAPSYDDVTEINPAEIEPAAGAEELIEETNENGVAESIKLPRKN